VITILVAGAALEELSEFSSGHPSVELVRAGTGEEVLDRLARNRRIDAVLLLGETASSEIATLIRDEDPAGPPLYAPASAGELPGVRSVDAQAARELFERIVSDLSTRS
jgi:hypothetical protein